MAIHVTTRYFSINTPKELEDKAFDLANIAALAKRLNLEDIYNQAKKAYIDLYNQWDKEGDAIAKKKTSIDWLGGGSKYMAHSLLPWETTYAMTEKLAQLSSIEECKEELNNLLSKC